MIDVPSISAIIAAASVVVGVVFAALQLRNAARERRIRLIVELNPAFHVSNKEFMEAWAKFSNAEFSDYDDFVEKYGDPIDSGKPVVRALSSITGYFEGVGFLLRKQLIDIDVVDYLMGGSVTMTWEMMKPIVEGVRKQYDYPKAFQWFEYLYNEMRGRERPVKT